ncbi:hypothetical protein EPUS_05344 [Endocarpon pusillum Z07020]|uniref:Uncharacterized protein n=1 Tax=Endocarpon pusillum (strain Z07020 / HMAS-L-300199) TaxID=1263415 RepID=U1GPM7_ENDPU|nr:uncharacterized protein EPUS_05344 [Endocarpon pusillum Z07020]ERF73921.1 hypothetical protein EPUS_05344 [Endocarpon pusillum Z07020]
MSASDIELASPLAPKDLIVKIVASNAIHGSEDRAYARYCAEELSLLHKGVAQETWQSQAMAVKTYTDLNTVMRLIQQSPHLSRPEIRRELSSTFATATVASLNSSINLALRLWLMINFQDIRFETLRHQATCIEWNESSTLHARVAELFPKARWDVSAATSRLGPYFTAVFLTQWDLEDFPVQIPPQSSTNQRSGERQVNVLRETLLSLDLLFPIRDHATSQLLEDHRQSFHESGPFLAQSSTLTLGDFDYWRDRLLELREVLDAPPVSWQQLYRDRRNPQQFWTFWIALFILALTLLSSIASLVQAWASLKALKMAQHLSA